MRTRIAVVVVSSVAAIACESGSTPDQRAAADARVLELAHCLERVAAGVSRGTMTPEYRDCVTLHLGGRGADNGFGVIDDGSDGRDLVVRLRTLMSAREQRFQTLLDRARAAVDDRSRRAVLAEYSAELDVTAVELRALVP